VQSWGTWIEDANTPENIILVICGNPGITQFYKDFLNALYEKLHMTTWVVCHAGHEMPTGRELELSSGMNTMYDVTAQVKHKQNVIRSYVPQGSKLFVIAHSFGAKVTLEMMKDKEIEEKVTKAFMMFPTVERIADAPNARFIGPMVRYFGPTLVFLSWFFENLFPRSVQWFLVSCSLMIGYHGGPPDTAIEGAIKLIRPAVLRNIFHLVKSEFNEIRELDVETLTRLKGKLKFYFGATDKWSPVEYYENLVEKVDGVDATMCEKGIPHAFIINSSETVAEMIAKWISEEIENSSCTL